MDSTITKRVGETITLTFDFSDQMVFGETLNPPLVASTAVSVFSGTDSNPSSILTGATTVSGLTTQQKITAGMAGVMYTVVGHATGSSGAIYRVVKRLAVLADPGSYQPSSLPILSGTLPSGVVGAAYSYNLSITGGYAPYAPDGVSSGSAPPWMGFTVVGNSLVCAGTPDVATTYVFSPQIADAALATASAPQNITFTRTAVVGDLGNGYVGDVVNYTYTASLGTAPYTFSIVAGALPTGTSMNSSGVVTGTYTATGTFNWTVQATDANGISATLVDTNRVLYAEIYVSGPTVGSVLAQYTNNGGLSLSNIPDTTLPATGAVRFGGGRWLVYPNSFATGYYTDNISGAWFSTPIISVLGATGLATDNNGVWLAVGNGASARSIDNGITWASMSSWTGASTSPTCLEYGNGTWIGGRPGGPYRYSTDNGTNWINGDPSVAPYAVELAKYIGGFWYFATRDSLYKTAKVRKSADGISGFTDVVSLPDALISWATNGNGYWVGLSRIGTVYYTNNNWSTYTVSAFSLGYVTSGWQILVYGASGYYLVDDNSTNPGLLRKSTDGGVTFSSGLTTVFTNNLRVASSVLV